ncbi:unnamed protein product [Dovyalis caffra]|uniref:Charged multivesicular body protein 7 n=1 Tax=Dovyalis caffra TaxID=77055 RepID=A0AAV1SC36_9ROSI|nr:unnamed protein product [Dovyalis caffra]
MDSMSLVKEFIRKEVAEWDDEIMATARFKAFSGQRSDWEPKYLFWRDLILKIARHLGLFIIRPSQVKEWFNRGGLTPLCLDHVLCIMFNEGDLVRSADLVDPSSGRLSQLFRKVRNLMVRSPITPEIIMLEDHLFLTPLLKDKTAEVVKLLSESHWTSSCIITMNKFQGMCGGPTEATALLSYLAGLGKAQYLSISKKEVIEGVKISLSSASVLAISNLDLEVLHLIWTTKKLEDQIDVIDRRYEMSRKSALASLSSGNKKVALRHAREMKVASEGRERCASLLNRVEEVLNVIANAESTKKVSEAIQIGAQAMKQNKITAEEVELCLEELEESIGVQKQVEKALESTPVIGIEDDDIEEEFEKLELELESENLQIPKIEAGNTSEEKNSLESTDSLTDALSNLKLQDGSAREPVTQKSPLPTATKNSKHLLLEAA